MPEAVENTIQIANTCNVELPVGKTMMPHYLVPSEYDTAGYFRKIVEDGLEERFKEFQLLKKKFDAESNTVKKTEIKGDFLFFMKKME